MAVIFAQLSSPITWRLATKHYPDTTVVDPIQRPLISDYLHGHFGQFALEALFSSYQIDIMARVIDENKEQYMRVMSWLSTTAPKPTADKNIDFTLHNFGFVTHEVSDVNKQFLDVFKGKDEFPKVEEFRGSYMRAAYILPVYPSRLYSPAFRHW